MKYGVSKLSIVPGRLEPADQSEMVTQVLFGEHYKITEERAKWCKIRSAYDKYECWIDKKQSFEISADDYKKIETYSELTFCSDLSQPVQNLESKEIIPIVLGCSLPLTKRNNQFTIADTDFVYIGVALRLKGINRQKLVEYANMYLNSPYLWGGKTPFGIDCSGLVQMVYRLCGVKLPRDASQQAALGTTLSFIEEAEEGDLAFFDNNEGDINHVGIILKDNYIIHASGKVRVDRIDHQGIYNTDNRDYSHKLRIIKKVIK
ncbi:MAG: C40 family peptidase [Flavobacteriales bacterium]|nr:C40 family peptidase [Flavobacteriales bacterium]